MRAAQLISSCLFLISRCESLQLCSGFIWEAETPKDIMALWRRQWETERERWRDRGRVGGRGGRGGTAHTRGERRESNQPAERDREIRSVWTTERGGRMEREREGGVESDCQKCYYSASSPLERRGYPSRFSGLSQPSLSSLYNVIFPEV